MHLPVTLRAVLTVLRFPTLTTSVLHLVVFTGTHSWNWSCSTNTSDGNVTNWILVPCSPLALLAQFGGGGGEAGERTTGAKALFCLTAAEKEKTPWEELQLDTAMVGLEGTTETQTNQFIHVLTTQCSSPSKWTNCSWETSSKWKQNEGLDRMRWVFGPGHLCHWPLYVSVTEEKITQWI